MAPKPTITVAARHLLPKSDAPFSDCEDSIAIDLRRFRFAVADGATEGFDSRRWARLLTRAWVSTSAEKSGDFECVDLLADLGRRLAKKWTGRPMPWYLEEKSATGAYAAFIGLQVTPDWIWRATAIGDSCLIVERDHVIQETFPLSSPSEFSSSPVLVASKDNRQGSRQALRLSQGVCMPGDQLLLMSDAIACWYLELAVSDRDVLSEFHGVLGDSAALTLFIERERKTHRLRNDDVAILKLLVGATAENAD